MKKDWALTESALRGLLDWMDEGEDSQGEKYLEMRRRLVSYFDRKNCPSPDEMADETLNRVARRLEEEGAITNMTAAHYCYVVAKFVFLECMRRTERKQASMEHLLSFAYAAQNPNKAFEIEEARAKSDRLLDCLERCLKALDPDSRELIFQYYHGEQRAKIESRRAIAARLGLTMNALSIRACRIRARLETCVSKCSDSSD